MKTSGKGRTRPAVAKRQAQRAIAGLRSYSYNYKMMGGAVGKNPATIWHIEKDPVWPCSPDLAQKLDDHLAVVQRERFQARVAELDFEVHELCSNLLLTPELKGQLDRCIQSRLLAAICPGTTQPLEPFPAGVPGAMVFVGHGENRLPVLIFDRRDPKALRAFAHELEHARQRLLAEADKKDKGRKPKERKRKSAF